MEVVLIVYSAISILVPNTLSPIVIFLRNRWCHPSYQLPLGSILDVTHRNILTRVCGPPSSFGNESHKMNTTFRKSSQDSYLHRIIRMLGIEIREIRNLEWQKWCQVGNEDQSMESFTTTPLQQRSYDYKTSSSPSPVTTRSSSPWKQHLAPQDTSLSSRKIRRRGCLSFLRELFNMVRMSVDQSDKNAFFARTIMRDICIIDEPVEIYDMDIHVGDDNDAATAESTSRDSNEFPSQPKETVNLLSLLGAILSDPNTDVSERGACLEILSAIAMHNPSFIRKHCLAEFSASESEGNLDSQSVALAKPQPNGNREVSD